MKMRTFALKFGASGARSAKSEQGIYRWRTGNLRAYGWTKQAMCGLRIRAACRGANSASIACGSPPVQGGVCARRGIANGGRI